MPRLGGKNHYWLNGLYEALCVIVVFPLIVALGAGGKLSEICSRKVVILWERFLIRFILFTIRLSICIELGNTETFALDIGMAFYYFDCSVLCDDGLCLSEIV